MDKEEQFRKTVSKLEALAKFEQYGKEGKWLACQFIPPSYFMHSCRIMSPLPNVNDLYCAAAACAQCELREACEQLGEDEPYGVWGGVARTGTKYRRRIYEGEWPYC